MARNFPVQLTVTQQRAMGCKGKRGLGAVCPVRGEVRERRPGMRCPHCPQFMSWWPSRSARGVLREIRRYEMKKTT